MNTLLLIPNVENKAVELALQQAKLFSDSEATS